MNYIDPEVAIKQRAKAGTTFKDLLIILCITMSTYV